MSSLGIQLAQKTSRDHGSRWRRLHPQARAKCAPAVACFCASSSFARPVDADLNELRPEGRTQRAHRMHPARSMQAWANLPGPAPPHGRLMPGPGGGRDER
jgi:hypothetical protein